MIDTGAITQAVNLSALIGRDSQETSKANRLWCPFCQIGGSSQHHSPALAILDKRRFYCHGCGSTGDAIDYVMLRDQVDFIEACKRLGWNGAQPDQNELTRLRLERLAQAERSTKERAARLDSLLAEYSAEEIWSAYHRRLTTQHREWWRGRGVPDEWQDYLNLGYTDKTYRGKDNQLHQSPAYVIPYFHSAENGRIFQTMQYRLDNPERPQDRYRFEHDLPVTYYQVVPDELIGDWAIICEGAIKAMVAAIYGDTPAVSVLAVPSKSAFAGLVEAVAGCRKVWIVLDPDCWTRPAQAPTDWMPAPLKLARAIGKAARIVRLAGKVDDMMLAGSLSPNEWKHELKAAQG